MAGFVCKALLLLNCPFLGVSSVVDVYNATYAVHDLADAHADSFDQPDGYSVDFAEDDIGGVSFIAPEKGDAVPAFPITFPGCSCEWNEGHRKGWSCEEDILAPESMAGQPCCCCTTSCLADHRCTNEECLLLGIDQAAGVEAEAAAKAKSDAEKAIPDFGDAQVTKVHLPAGLCSLPVIWSTCRAQGMWPLCNDWNAYVSMDVGKPGCKRAGNRNTCNNNHNCFFPFQAGTSNVGQERDTKLKEWQWISFANPEHLRKMGINPLKMGGTCTYKANGGTQQGIGIRGPLGGGAWTPSGGGAKGKAFTYKNMDGEGDGNDLAARGWDTWCVNQKPLPYIKQGYNGPDR